MNVDPRTVLLAQAGDRNSIDSLIESLQRPLFLYIRRYVKEKSLSEDILQDALLQVFRKLGSLKDPNLFKAWAYQIATRGCFKKLKNFENFVEMDESTASQLDSSDLNLDIDIRNALTEISSASQAVLTLHYLEGFSLDEVAAILGIPLGTVKSRLNYGLNQLRQRLS